jgi:uncharacterized membrane protein YfcA
LPAHATALIVAYGLIVQGISVWKLRRSIKLARLLPFLAGAVIGVPIGVELLHWTSPAALRISIGIVLILFSLYNLIRPQLAPVTAGKAADGAIGVTQRCHRGCDRPRGDCRYDLVHFAGVVAR